MESLHLLHCTGSEALCTLQDLLSSVHPIWRHWPWESGWQQATSVAHVILGGARLAAAEDGT